MIMFRKSKTSFLSLVLAGILAGLAVIQAPAQQPAPQAPAQTAAQEPAALVGNLNLQDASLTEVVDQLARQKKINIQVDPRVKGKIGRAHV